jgi:DUF1680 family protein
MFVQHWAMHKFTMHRYSDSVVQGHFKVLLNLELQKPDTIASLKHMLSMFKNKNFTRSLSLLCAISFAHLSPAQSPPAIHVIHPANLTDVEIHDSFWSPKMRVWNTKTVYDVFDKLEGKYEPDRKDLIDEKQRLGRTRNAFLNFDLVAQGKKDINAHDGPPWYDGLVYETIRGAADLLVEHPDKNLEHKIDGYIDRIAAAQAVDKDGYVNTYTTLTRPGKRWGRNGGDDKWQHDIYNAGMLQEAAIHYYKATGKTRLLDVAVKLSNYIDQQIGPAPKLNVVPGHGGPEETMLKLYQLFKEHPELKREMSVPVNEDAYYNMAKFWIEERGNYGEKDGSHSRNSDSSYNQDHMPVLQQQTIEGHAVRATLLATGVTGVAIENKDPRYINTANNYWNNMIGKRMFITGGAGAIASGERFGADYYLPESAYLETCASIGAGFFSEKMNELQADGKYMDEFERILYNNLLSGVSLSGDQYFYENPLVATDHKRWAWHDCPCCPPMILKMVGALPQYIYAYDEDNVYVNLFIGSNVNVAIDPKTKISLKQTTQYPWKGKTIVEVTSVTPSTFTLNVRIPGWAQNKENPFDLYHSQVSEPVTLLVNGKSIKVDPVNGYAAINRTWKKGDVVELNLPMQPRVITPADSTQTIKGKLALASGPVIYSFEGIDNADINQYSIRSTSPLSLVYKPDLLNGINVITGKATTTERKQVTFTAIPFYTIGNRSVSPYKVWFPGAK